MPAPLLLSPPSLFISGFLSVYLLSLPCSPTHFPPLLFSLNDFRRRSLTCFSVTELSTLSHGSKNNFFRNGPVTGIEVHGNKFKWAKIFRCIVPAVYSGFNEPPERVLEQQEFNKPRVTQQCPSPTVCCTLLVSWWTNGFHTGKANSTIWKSFHSWKTYTVIIA